MKKTISKIGAISAALLALTISVNAQWTRNAVTGVTSLQFPTDKVGIGTTSPSYSLDIKQDANCSFRVQSKVSGSSNLILSRSLQTTNCLVNYKTGLTDLWYTGCLGNDDFRLRNAANNDVLYANQAGNVGIGTANPTRKLHVIKEGISGGTPNPNAVIVLENNTATYLQLLCPNADENGILFGTAADFNSGGIIYNHYFFKKGLQFRTNGNISRMVIDSIGNVGIGTATPAAKLDIAGKIKITDGTQAVGKILKSDAIGLASWGTLSGFDLLTSPMPAANLACPELIGSVGMVSGSNPTYVTISGSYAYVANQTGNSMSVINITNPTTPTIVGSVVTGNAPVSIAVSGSYAYLTNYNSNTMQVINITNPASPTVVGSVSTGNNPRKLAVLGNYAYVVNTGSNTLQVINISNPVSPTVVGTVTTENGPTAIAVSGSYAYVTNANQNSMQVINITNPVLPTVVSSVATGTGPLSIAVSGNYAYVANYDNNNMQVINISNPAAPVITGTVVVGIAPTTVSVKNGYAYVTNNLSANMVVINISNPALPIMAASVPTGSLSHNVALSGNYAYVVNYGSNNMQVFNLACATNLTINPTTGQTTAVPNLWNAFGSNIGNANTGNVGIGTITPNEKLTVYNGTSTGTYTTTGWVHSSDARLKTNVKTLEGSLAKILKLKGVSYNWNANPSDNNQIGFIAQEVENVFPEVIVKDAAGNYGMAQQNLVAPIVEAIKEQQKQLDAKDEMIKSLQSTVGNLQTQLTDMQQCVESLCNTTLQTTTSNPADANLDKAASYLFQNSPNPFNQSTVIRYALSSENNSGKISIRDLNGNMVKQINISNSGKGQVTINANELVSGTYTYTLEIAGTSVDTKLMVVTK